MCCTICCLTVQYIWNGKKGDPGLDGKFKVAISSADGLQSVFAGTLRADLGSGWHLEKAHQVDKPCSRQFDFILTRLPFLPPRCAIFRDAGRQGLEEQPTMDKVVSLLISVGIITFGAWVTAATIAKDWPLVWTLMALFPLLTRFISLYDSIKGTED